MFLFDILSGLFSKIKRLINKLKPSTAKALALSTQLKEFLDSPAVDLIVTLIPGTWDNAAKAEAQLALNYAIPFLQTTNKCGTDPQCWFNEVKTWPKEMQNAAVLKYASLLLKFFDDFKHTEAEYDTVIQNVVFSGK